MIDLDVILDPVKIANSYRNKALKYEEGSVMFNFFNECAKNYEKLLTKCPIDSGVKYFGSLNEFDLNYIV